MGLYHSRRVYRRECPNSSIHCGNVECRQTETIARWRSYGGIPQPLDFLDKNVVGSPNDLSPVISTLLSSFEYCRGFSDPLDSSDGPKNMAIFCSSSAITFRQPLDEDFQGSGMRQRVLAEFPNHEIQFTGGSILTDKHSYLGVDPALEHWHVIRTVLPAEIWINY